MSTTPSSGPDSAAPTADTPDDNEPRSLVTYTDPTAWMTDAERAYHTHGGVTR